MQTQPLTILTTCTAILQEDMGKPASQYEHMIQYWTYFEGGLDYETSSQSGSFYSGYSAPAVVSPSTWTEENPQKKVEIKMVAEEYLTIVNVVGPMLAGDPNFGAKTIEAVDEAYRIVRPNTQTLPENIDNGIRTLVSCPT